MLGTPGRFEFELLSHLSMNGPCTSRELYEGFGVPRGYVRGTIIKALDRLHRRGRVQRETVDGKYVYSVADGAIDSEQGLVATFIQERLHGRVSPILAYFAESPKMSREDLEELKAIVEKLERDAD